MHDRLIEHGYFGLQDDLGLIVRADVGGEAIRKWLRQFTTEFQRPATLLPVVEFLQ